MIETAISKKNQAIVKFDGKYVCSSVDPSTEAQAWVEKNSIQAVTACHILVLGAGSGYHLVALSKRYPDKTIVVIDKSPEFIEFCKIQHNLDLLNVHWIHVSKISDIKSNSILKTALSGEYTLLKFGPVTQLANGFYNELQEFLNGRTPEGLQFVTALRPQLIGVFAPELFQPLRAAGSRLLSIKDLKANLKSSDESYSGQIIRLLGELIA